MDFVNLLDNIVYTGLRNGHYCEEMRLSRSSPGWAQRQPLIGAGSDGCREGQAGRFQ